MWEGLTAPRRVVRGRERLSGNIKDGVDVLENKEVAAITVIVNAEGGA